MAQKIAASPKQWIELPPGNQNSICAIKVHLSCTWAFSYFPCRFLWEIYKCENLGSCIYMGAAAGFKWTILRLSVVARLTSYFPCLIALKQTAKWCSSTTVYSGAVHLFLMSEHGEQNITSCLDYQITTII
jgi:hypothetical protein